MERGDDASLIPILCYKRCMCILNNFSFTRIKKLPGKNDTELTETFVIILIYG